MIRSWVVEDSIVSEVDRQPDQLQLALVAAIAQAALIQMDAEFRGMATLGHNPIVWTIFEDERQFIDKFHRKQVPAPDTVEHARSIVRRLSTGAARVRRSPRRAAIAAATYFNTIPSLRVRSLV